MVDKEPSEIVGVGSAIPKKGSAGGDSGSSPTTTAKKPKAKKSTTDKKQKQRSLTKKDIATKKKKKKSISSPGTRTAPRIDTPPRVVDEAHDGADKKASITSPSIGDCRGTLCLEPALPPPRQPSYNNNNNNNDSSSSISNKQIKAGQKIRFVRSPTNAKKASVKLPQQIACPAGRRHHHHRGHNQIKSKQIRGEEEQEDDDDNDNDSTDDEKPVLLIRRRNPNAINDQAADNDEDDNDDNGAIKEPQDCVTTNPRTSLSPQEQQGRKGKVKILSRTPPQTTSYWKLDQSPCEDDDGVVDDFIIDNDDDPLPKRFRPPLVSPSQDDDCDDKDRTRNDHDVRNTNDTEKDKEDSWLSIRASLLTEEKGGKEYVKEHDNDDEAKDDQKQQEEREQQQQQEQAQRLVAGLEVESDDNDGFWDDDDDSSSDEESSNGWETDNGDDSSIDIDDSEWLGRARETLLSPISTAAAKGYASITDSVMTASTVSMTESSSIYNHNQSLSRGPAAMMYSASNMPTAVDNDLGEKTTAKEHFDSTSITIPMSETKDPLLLPLDRNTETRSPGSTTKDNSIAVETERSEVEQFIGNGGGVVEFTSIQVFVFDKVENISDERYNINGRREFTSPSRINELIGKFEDGDINDWIHPLYRNDEVRSPKRTRKNAIYSLVQQFEPTPTEEEEKGKDDAEDWIDPLYRSLFR